jgi:hypothetical protein
MRLLVLGIFICLVHVSLWLRMRKTIDRHEDGWFFKQTKIEQTVPDHWLFTFLDTSNMDPDTTLYKIIRLMEGGPDPEREELVKDPSTTTTGGQNGVTDENKTNALADWQASQ